MEQYLIAHDLGTSGDKASLFTTSGKLVKSHTVSYPVHFFHDNYAEQNPEDWWNAVIASTRLLLDGICPDDVLALSFSAQMQCCLITGQNGVPLRPAMIWADQRAEEEKAYLEARIGFDRIYDITGHRVSSSYSLEKLMWLQKHEPENYKKTYCMLQVKDYILFRLTGSFVTDYSDASGTNALDLRASDWSDEILSAADIDRALLPALHSSTDQAGELSSASAQLLGLSPSTKIIIGGGDGPCSALGAGCIEPGKLFLTYGTSAWIGGTTDQVFSDPDKILFCFAHVIPGKFMPCGTMQSAGSSYSYIRNALCRPEMDAAVSRGGDPYEELNHMLLSSPAGAKGLLFLPYLLGERSPRWNADASGAFLNIRQEHQKEDYIRAVVEGIAMNLDLILASYRRQLPVSSMIFTGGGAKGNSVSQILSDILQSELVRPDHVEEATSIAAAVIAGVGCGIYPDFSAVSLFLTRQDSFSPHTDHMLEYEYQKKMFSLAYECLLPFYKAQKDKPVF